MAPLKAILLAFLLSCTGCSHLFYFPDQGIHFPPEKNGYTAQDIYFKSLDGTKLHAWYIAHKNKKIGKALGTIVQFHGNAENLSSHYASLVWLTDLGYDLFTFDYRGYGESEGEPNQEGIYKDGMAALDKAWELHQRAGAKKFIVYGQSLGGAIAMRSFVDFRHQEQTALVVMDSTFLSYKDVAHQKLAQFWMTWLFSPLGWILVSDKFAPEKVISRFHSRLLVIHDQRDPVVSFENGQKLYDQAKTQKEFWKLNQGRHVGIFWIDTSKNRERFVNYLETI